MTTQKKEKRRKDYAAPALEKGLDILELLSEEPDGLSLSEICNRLGRSTSELFRMLAVLEQRGYVSSAEGSDRYALTMQLFQLAHRYPPVKRLTAVAGPVMRKLSFLIEQSCHLVIYYEGKGHVVVQQDAPSARNFSVRLGADAPLASSCSGRVLLAFADEVSREYMLKAVPKGHPALSAKNARTLVERIRNQGYEMMDSGQAMGVRDIGYPIFDYSGHISAALVVPFMAYIDNSHPLNFDQVREHIEYCAQEINDLLGAPTSDSAA